MKKAFILVILLIGLFFFPVKVDALSVSEYASFQTITTYSLQSNTTCTGENSILGNPKDPDSVAWLIDKILTWATVIGMVLVVVFSSIDFLKVIVKSDDDTMSKAFQKLIIRLVLAALLFFVPTLTNALLDLFGLTSASTCGIQQ